ncbi:uncharacterized protein SAPINGB_P004955 [Magnusiomyces paraingens]|uniref:Mannose-6-phosphate isomerase n=1 Tax=Magnusiomyces paraingens TaxID=2606893 RepID=A0A5E8C2W5_9ASCO|nr:uncharacterized protein SAPINGB_P004955 [Saprochaete ingens]VVT56311.1 unnamed protein product [Saprochaete ingens]
MSQSDFDLVKLHCGVQTYDWGKLGESSAVAQFAESADPSFKADPTKPYAELWMGTHPSVPSFAVSSSVQSTSLRTVLSKYPGLMGDRITAKFGPGELPFLFKVLSIRKALSIQAHPDKALGKQLHASDPKNYPDGNHKPEMAIAITDFEGFCGFRPLAEISALLKNIPEFVELIGGQKFADEFINGYKELSPEDKEGSPKDVSNRKVLQALFSRVMNASQDTVSKFTVLLVERASREQEKFGSSIDPSYKGPFGKSLADLIIRLNKQFPEDIGLFCGGLMLNYVTLKSGEAMFLRAKDPHAYISGDIIECMAASDNVVRAGFTPKFKDVPNLVSMLTYSYDPVEKQKMVPEPYPLSKSSSDSVKNTLFNPPIDEFAVVQTVLSKKGDSTTLQALDGPSIIIITEGSAKLSSKTTTLDFPRGQVAFIGAGTAVELTNTGDDEVVTYTAIVEVSAA